MRTRTASTSKPSRTRRAPQRPFGAGLEPRTRTYIDDDYRPAVSPYAPTPEDREWAENALRRVFDESPAPAPSLADRLTALAQRFRERGDDFTTFVGFELDRLAMLAGWIGATTPADFDTRREANERETRAAWEDRGYEAGLSAGRSECVAFDGRID